LQEDRDTCPSAWIATHIPAFEGDSHVEWAEGDFDTYEAAKRGRRNS
jgi:hypothetical protein